MEFGSTTEFTCRFEIQDVNATGEATAKVTFENAEQNGYASMGTTAIPGMDALTGGVGKALRAIQGESFTCTLAPDGKVTNVKGMEPIAKKAADKIEVPAGPMAAMLKPALTTQLNQSLSNGAMEKLWTNAFDFYPGKPVKVNDSWDVSSDISGQGMASFPMKVAQKLTVKALQGGTATLESASTVTSDAGGSGAGGVKVKDLKGTEAGTLDIDIASGWIKKGSSTLSITGSIEMPIPGMAGGMTMAIETKSLIESFDV
jgi:hypothetical protein